VSTVTSIPQLEDRCRVLLLRLATAINTDMKTGSRHLGFGNAACHRESDDDFLDTGDRVWKGEKPGMWERGELAEKERFSRREVLLQHT
jgi:hypothetical protein